jgi:hypothetical protein
MIKGILIDVENQVVKEVTFKNKLEEYYRLLKCNLITAPSFDENHDIIADDEGLLKPNNFFQYEEIELAGNCMIVGVTESGNWKSHSLNFEEIKSKITFHTYVRFNGVVMKLPL